MKDFAIILFFIFLGKVGFANYVHRFEDDSLKQVSIDNNQIRYNDKLVGKYTTKTI